MSSSDNLNPQQLAKQMTSLRRKMDNCDTRYGGVIGPNAIQNHPDVKKKAKLGAELASVREKYRSAHGAE